MTVGLVGVGQLGSAIGERILLAGHPLVVFNRTRAKAEPLVRLGATVAGTLPELMQAVAVCVTVVADDDALEAVTSGPGGLLEGAAPGTTLVDMSTVSRAASARVAEAAEGAGVRYLRAPVSGNPTVVRSGNLTIIVSGPAGALADTRALLEGIGPRIFHVGTAEEARVVKLALQILIGGTAELLAEALALGEAGGVAAATLLEVLGGSVVGSRFLEVKAGPLLAGDYTPTFTTSMMQKDAGLVLALAAETGVSVPFAERLQARLADTIAAGHGEDDFMSLFLTLRPPAAEAPAAPDPDRRP